MWMNKVKLSSKRYSKECLQFEIVFVELILFFATCIVFSCFVYGHIEKSQKMTWKFRRKFVTFNQLNRLISYLYCIIMFTTIFVWCGNDNKFWTVP
jgi:uncharacterized BrkB/YihY/UPF0761 family membrane protein